MGVYTLVRFKFINKSGTVPKNNYNEAVISSENTNNVIASALPINNLKELFTLLENKQQPLPLVAPEKFWQTWTSAASVMSSRDQSPVITDITVNSNFNLGKSKDNDIFLVLHQNAVESSLKYYGPFKGNIPDLLKQIKALKKDQEIYPGFKVQSVQIRDNFNKF